MSMVVVVTGGRNFNDRDKVWSALTMLYQKYLFDALHHGDASGVDKLCDEWCTEWFVPCYAHRADWGNLTAPGAIISQGAYGPYNRLAGFQRNESMLFEEPKPNYGIVFPGGNGTRDMKNRMIKAGLTVWEPYP